MFFFVKRVLLPLFLLLTLLTNYKANANQHIQYIKTKDNLSIYMMSWISDNKNKYYKNSSVLILPGMGEPIENFYDMINNFINKYDIFFFDWRGQGKSSSYTKYKNVCHIKDFNLYLKDLESVIDHLPKNKPIFIIANSMGSHLIMKYLLQEKNLDSRICGLVLMAPMISVNINQYAKSLIKLISYLVKKFNYEEYSIWSYFYIRSRENNFITPSFAWLEAYFQSEKKILDMSETKKIEIPILVLNSIRDRIVNNKVNKNICFNMSKCYLKEYDSSHIILKSKKTSLKKYVYRDIEVFFNRLSCYYYNSNKIIY